MIGHFEQLVLLTIMQLGEEAYGLTIRDELIARSGRSVARGALYTTLDRLTGKGLVSWEVSDSTPERGGLPRRRFSVTPDGVAILSDSRRTLLDFWRGLEGRLK